jgi:branched-chain amino acid aminotransferase
MLKRSYSSALTASALTINKAKSLKEPTPLSKLVFGQTFTDHMLTIDWTNTKGWKPPQILPYAKLAIDPSSVCLHYGIQCFEGMKAYKDSNGKIRLFRPAMNMARLLKSSQRLALPSFDKQQLLQCIKEFLKVEERWIPDKRGYSLYLRPTAIGTQESLGVGPTNRATLFVIA